MLELITVVLHVSYIQRPDGAKRFSNSLESQIKILTYMHITRFCEV